MATLDTKSIKETISEVVKYNNNPDKNRPLEALSVAAAYIRGEHSVERLYSRGHNGCSSNPEVAIQQFKACEALYRARKGGAKEAGMGRYEMDAKKYSKKFKVPLDQIELNENGKVWVDKQPTIAEHIFVSFHQDEDVPYNTQCEIIDELCQCEVLRDFYAISNRHYNTDNDHTHVLVPNVSKDGSKKLSMNNAKRYALRKELDRICVERGLSIIDDPILRWEDPEREAWVRGLIENGTVTVYVPADFERQYENYKKKHEGQTREYDEWLLKQIEAGKVARAEGVSKNREWDEEEKRYRGATQAEAYKKWIAEQDYFIREKKKAAAKNAKAVLLAEEETKKKIARMYYWEQHLKSSRNGKYYAVRRYDDNGYHKPLLVLIIELRRVADYYERSAYLEKYPKANFGPTDWSVQKSLDMLHYQDEHDVRTPEELEARLHTVGTDLSETRQGLTYYKSAVAKGDDLHRAIQTFKTLDAKEDRTEEEDMVRSDAYRIMAAHKCTSDVEIHNFYYRRQFAEKKVIDLTERVDQLKKDYHDLKFIESQSDRVRIELERMIYANEGTHGLDSIASQAAARRGTSASGWSRSTAKETEWDDNE